MLISEDVGSICFNKACRLGSATDGVEKREGKEVFKASAFSSTCWITCTSCHAVATRVTVWSKLS